MSRKSVHALSAPVRELVPTSVNEIEAADSPAAVESYSASGTDEEGSEEGGEDWGESRGDLQSGRWDDAQSEGRRVAHGEVRNGKRSVEHSGGESLEESEEEQETRRPGGFSNWINGSPYI
jgi:hypothetical protein